jgi:hypothetical protein
VFGKNRCDNKTDPLTKQSYIFNVISVAFFAMVVGVGAGGVCASCERSVLVDACSIRRISSPIAISFYNLHRGFPKTSVFGKASLNFPEKAGFRPLFPKLFRKPTGFWEKLHLSGILFHITIQANILFPRIP